MPSFYALEAVRAAEGRLPDFAELARRAETVSSARVGWPAPSDPAVAIDDAEYDLAFLDRLFTRSDQDAGSARYLVTSNPYLARALQSTVPTLELPVDAGGWAGCAVEHGIGDHGEARTRRAELLANGAPELRALSVPVLPPGRARTCATRSGRVNR